MVMMVLVACIIVAGVAWLWRQQHDPLLYLVPLCAAFPPLFAYGASVGWPGPLGWLSTRKALVASLLLTLVVRAARLDFTYRPLQSSWRVLPYLGLVTVSVVWSVLGPYNGEAAMIANQWLTWLIPVLVALTLAGSPMGEDAVCAATRTLLIVLLCTSIYAGFQMLVVMGLDRFVPEPIADLTRYAWRDLTFGRVRLYGTLPNLGPNFFGAFLLGPTVLAFSRAFGQRGWIRVGWLLAAILGVGVIGSTYSRGAMLGLLVALLVLPVWRRSSRGIPLLAATLAIAAIGVAASPIGRHIVGLYASGQFDVSGSARLYLWRAILNSAAEHPLGLGFNGWERASMYDVNIGFEDPPAAIGTPHPAENQWMREVADRGVLGVGALALLLGGLIGMTFRGSRETRAGSYVHDFVSAAGATFGGWAFVFLTGDHLMYDSVAAIFWYFAAVAIAAARDTNVEGDGRAPTPHNLMPRFVGR